MTRFPHPFSCAIPPPRDTPTCAPHFPTQILAYALRPILTSPKPVGFDDLLNWAYILTVDYLVLRYWGLQSFLYLVYSSVIGGGLHPMAGHFIAEHYVFVDGQETYSYYGLLNLFTYNVGFHVEHHDFPRIPGTRLPMLHRICPEFYSHLHHHKSWLWVIWQYLTSPAMGPFARVKRRPYAVVRNERSGKEARKVTTRWRTYDDTSALRHRSHGSDGGLLALTVAFGT